LRRRLILILVAFHPSAAEVAQLRSSLETLSPEVGYAVVVNDHRPGEPADALAHGADMFLPLNGNPGYGRAVNRLLAEFRHRFAPAGMPEWIGTLNTDLTWSAGTFERMIHWLEHHQDVVMAVPLIQDSAGEPQRLCKRHPTVLGLLSRRFLPEGLKPAWLRRYDRQYVMGERDLSEVFDVPYLSGCCMIIRHQAFAAVGGFDERYFLYLEDADITRRLSALGRCVHLPVARVCHEWGRGNHRSLKLTLVNLQSAWIYFTTWGWRWW
jgi:GT2 family glycosyltransferase